MPDQNLAPVAPKERIQTIDILRAIALFGVVVANFTVDNSYVSPGSGRRGFLDQLAYWPIRFFIDDKAMAMYCFLFGIGFSIQMMRAEARKANYVFLHLRRMIALFIIGIIALILTDETIPHEYAMVGLLLLLFYKIPWRLLPLLALLCVVVPFTKNLIDIKKATQEVNKIKAVTIDNSLLDACTGVYERENEPGRYNVITREGNRIFSLGRGGKFPLITQSPTEFVVPNSVAKFTFVKDSFGSVTKLLLPVINGFTPTCIKIKMDIKKAEEEMHRQILRPPRPPQDTTTYKQFIVRNSKNVLDRFKNWSWRDFFLGVDISGILSFFLIGLYAGRRKIFYNITGNRSFLKKVMWGGFVLGVSGMSIGLGLEIWPLITHIQPGVYFSAMIRAWFQFAWNFGVLSMTFAYVAGITLLLEKEDWKKRLSFLAPVGRMGFTNYLLHTIPYVIIFHYGFNLAGKVGPFYRLLMALPVYVALIFLSRWWFKHFSIGPAEWLWRSLTYLKFQPMRLKQSNEKSSNEV